MSAPVGVITHDDGSIDLVDVVPPWHVAPATAPAVQPQAYDALRGVVGDGAVFPAVWQDADLERYVSTPWGSDCGKLDCSQFGCWCPSFPGETFHCSHCINPFDDRYQCNVYAGMCVGCCGHETCAAQWQHLTERSGL